MINTANLKKRLLFVAVAVPVAYVVVNLHVSLSALALKLLGMPAGACPDIYLGQIVILGIVLLGAHEYMKMLSIVNRVNAFWLGHLWILVMSAAYLLGYVDSPIPGKNIPSMVSSTALLILVASEAFLCGKDAPQGRWKRASLFFCGTYFLHIAAIALMSFYRDPFEALFIRFQYPMIAKLDMVVVITATFMCDSAAYFVGSAWGKRRLTSISPKKTVEGSAAGLAASMIIMAVCWVFIRNPEYPIFIGVVMGALIGVMAQVGDLLVSLIKRYFRVKDASHIIPGHGGILDRFDSLFFTAPVLYLFAWLLTR
jgi:phosphatidate cytidylyltransferase